MSNSGRTEGDVSLWQNPFWANRTGHTGAVSWADYLSVTMMDPPFCFTVRRARSWAVDSSVALANLGLRTTQTPGLSSVGLAAAFQRHCEFITPRRPPVSLLRS